MSECLKNLKYFCYVCGKCTAQESLRSLSIDAEKAYEKYFDEKVIRGVDWVPTKICKTCYTSLIEWWNHKRNEMQFGIPVIWTAPGNSLFSIYYSKLVQNTKNELK